MYQRSNNVIFLYAILSISLHGIVADVAWIKTKGACRYSDGSFRGTNPSFANTKVSNHDECKDFCIKHSKCDAFNTDGSECFLFGHKDGKKYTGDGKGLDFCYIRAVKTPATSTTIAKKQVKIIRLLQTLQRRFLK